MRSWIGGLHFYWLDEAKTKLMCNGYRVPDAYIGPLEKKIGPIDSWDVRLESDRDFEEKVARRKDA